MRPSDLSRGPIIFTICPSGGPEGHGGKSAEAPSRRASYVSIITTPLDLADVDPMDHGTVTTYALSLETTRTPERWCSGVVCP